MCTCGQPNHPGEPCNEHKKCINCEGQHAADSRECPRMKEEIVIQRVRTLEKISYLEAKRKICICGRPKHDTTPCDTPMHCVNCEGEHAANSRACPKMKEEIAIQKVRTMEKLSYLEAKKKVIRPIPQKSYSEIAATTNPTKKPRLPKLFCNPTAAKNLREMNRIIAADISDQTDFKDLHAMIYAGAFAVLKLNDQRPTDVTSRKGTKRQPAWESRLSKNIDNIRSDIAILTQYQKPTYSQRVKKKGDTIMRRYTSEENPTIVEVLDLLKQRLLALSQRVKRYKKSSQRRKQNILFHRNQRAFYKSVGKESDRTLQGKTSFPNTEDIRHFWSGIWSNPREHRTAHWYQQEKARTSIQAMLSWTITKDDVVKAIGRTSNWRAPGPDGVHNYWIKAFTSTHQQLAKCYSTFLERPETIPEFLTTGVTYLIPKTEQYTADPAKYRPITCLSTAYKLLTAILADKVHNHLERNTYWMRNRRDVGRAQEDVKNN
ncbi:unnamed protein product [Acanthoscelides obtectus]|uniref:Reverse transcriptase n=1 Tax=Acanthoscelides obtectus TaxID=200917 RepID=A0A9P0QG56_ACAOB|nr:unnamed protein product [Acanthoscelides obtectus]